MKAVKLPRLYSRNMAHKAILHPVDVAIDENLKPLNTANMTLPKDEWADVHDFVELFTQRGSAGVYRVASVRKTYSGESTVELEHGICVLGDGIIPGEGELTGDAADVIGALLAHQVKQVNGANLWQAGSIAGGDAPFAYDYNNLQSAIIDVVDGLDGHRMTFDQSALPWTLHVAPYESEPSCEARLSRNIVSLSVTYDDSDQCTRLYCDALEGDTKYIDGPTIGTYGVICKTISAGESVTQESLRSYMVRYLEEHKDPTVSIEIDALDLSEATGEPLDALDVGKLCRIALPDYGVTLNERIIGRHTASAYNRPESVRLSLANRIKDTAQNFVLLKNEVDGGTSKNSATGGGRYGYGSGTGLSQKSVLDMLRVQGMTLTEQGADIYDNQIQITEQGVRISASEQHLDTAFSRLESAEAEIIVQAGEILQRATYTDLEGLETEVYIDINAMEDEITLKASKVYVDAEITAVRTLVAEEIEAEIGTLELSIAEKLITGSLTANTGIIGALTLGGDNVTKTTIPVVTSFTQASGEGAETTNYTLLHVGTITTTVHDVANGETKTFSAA